MNNIYAMEEASLQKYLWLQDNISYDAVTRYHGISDNFCYEVKRYGNVGVISVSGIITRHIDMVAKFFGGGSAGVEEISKDFQSLLDNPKIKAIVFDFDTPGGTITGVNELAEIIYNSRGIKPIKAYVTGMACSAGYFLAAACEEIIIDEMAQVGSIGVMRVVAKKNNKAITFKSSQSPMKNIDAESEKGRIEYQTKVDYFADIFISKVAKYRNITKEEVINRGNKGSILIGAVAVTSGLADRIGSMDNLIEELNKIKENNIMSNKEIICEKNIDTAMIEKNAVAVERKRVADLMAIKVKGCEEIVKEAIATGLSVEEVNARIVAFIQTESYEAGRHSIDKVTAIEPIVAAADIPNISEEDTKVNSMIAFANNLK